MREATGCGVSESAIFSEKISKQPTCLHKIVYNHDKLFSSETAFPALREVFFQTKPRHPRCWLHRGNLFRVPFKPPTHLFAAFSARRAVNEGEPRLPQSGRRGSHTPTRFARLIQILDETDGAPVAPTEAFGGIHEAATEVQVVGVAGIDIAGRT